jgi:hypothetical protein
LAAVGKMVLGQRAEVWVMMESKRRLEMNLKVSVEKKKIVFCIFQSFLSVKSTNTKQKKRKKKRKPTSIPTPTLPTNSSRERLFP